jgi:hypothetical protein
MLRMMKQGDDEETAMLTRNGCCGMKTIEDDLGMERDVWHCHVNRNVATNQDMMTERKSLYISGATMHPLKMKHGIVTAMNQLLNIEEQANEAREHSRQPRAAPCSKRNLVELSRQKKPPIYLK